MEEYDYKQDIVATRVGGLGASDGRLLARIARNGCVQQGEMERMAIAKGLYERPNITNLAMRYGDFIENKVFESLQLINPEYKSNLYYESKDFSREGLKLFCHIDFSLQDDKEKLLTWTECKATTMSVNETIEAYKEQLYTEWMLCQEMALELGYYFKFRLCHYDARDMLDEYGEFKFEPGRLVIVDVDFEDEVYDIELGMDIASEFVADMTEYHKEEIEWEYLPEHVQYQMEAANKIMTAIKEREAELDSFKARMYDFLCDNDIKSIKTPFFSINRVDAGVSYKFDTNAFKKDEPELYKKYLKESKKKGYAMIRMKEQTKNIE